MPSEDAHDHPVARHGWQRDRCFGCGPANTFGLQLRFVPGPGGDRYGCEFELSAHFGGPPGHAHGGIVATILDEAMSKANRLRSQVALTRRLEVDYLKPVPLGQKLIVEGRVGLVRGRALYNRAELRNAQGVVLARGRGKFLAIDAEKIFARELAEERREARSVEKR
jgi:acyl-coenzyme A thioesterase PaaI-like protein